MSARKRDPKSPNAWYNIGLLAKNTGDAHAAIDAFRHVVEIDANDADTWYFLGASYVQAKQFPQAIEAFQHALQLNPVHASAEFGLSRAYQQSGEIDHARDHLKKFQYITQNKIGAPISLAYGEQGQYSRAVEAPSAVLKAPAQIKVQFVDVTREAGLVGKVDWPTGDVLPTTPELLSPGACFLDYDGDGRLDIFVASNGSSGGMGLYHNLGNGKFEEVTRRAGIDPALHGFGCTAGDYDNDGAVDLAVTSTGRLLLLHNEKNGTFRDAAGAAGISDVGNILGVTFIDYDHDGDLDLYVTHIANRKITLSCGPGMVCGEGYSLTMSKQRNTVWRNNGNGTFSDVTRETGLSGTGGVAAVGSDYDNDRAVDVVVAGQSAPAVFRNPREGSFQLLEPWRSAMPNTPNGIAVLDFDHDGWMDLGFTHDTPPGLTLWRNNHGKSFDRVQLTRDQLGPRLWRRRPRLRQRRLGRSGRGRRNQRGQRRSASVP